MNYANVDETILNEIIEEAEWYAESYPQMEQAGYKIPKMNDPIIGMRELSKLVNEFYGPSIGAEVQAGMYRMLDKLKEIK